MKNRRTAVTIVILAIILLISAFGCYAEVNTSEQGPKEPAATETVIPAQEDTAADDADEPVEDPDFAHMSDPLANLRLIVGALGAFAIAFLYSRMQYYKNNRKKKR